MSATLKCPSCGAGASGRFCSSCGAALAGGACGSCGEPLAAGARFCRACGTTAGTPAPRGTAPAADRTPWIVAGIAAVAFLAVTIAWLARGETGAAATTVATSAPSDATAAADLVDLSSMTPKERFDRLYNRVMRAAEAGDMATVDRFSPMAVMAYAQLDSVDADARYHLSMLLLHTGQVPAAKAAADSIQLAQPKHLFGYMIAGSVARFRKDTPALQAAYRGFLAAYEAELAAGRQEYQEHERAVADFRAAALEGTQAN